MNLIGNYETVKLHHIILFIIIGTTTIIDVSYGHGRLIEPPSRSSAWRYGFNTPPNYNDHELFCGGFARQQKNGGQCGECGDAWDLPQPRPNEYGGKWGEGVVVRQYKIGSIITLRIELTASHMGYFEFRLCPKVDATQECLDKHLLEIYSGTPSIPQPSDLNTRFYPRNGSRIYDIKGKLPDDVECTNCLLQWRYVAGNNWGMCKNGSGAVGCGPQEEFRACADINVGVAGPPLIRPTMKTTPRTKITEPTEKSENGTTHQQPPTQEETNEERYTYLGIVITILSLLLVLCIIAIIYIYHYHGQRIKHILQWKYDKNKENKSNINGINKNDGTVSSITKTIVTSLPPPVPPPRTKRLTQIVKDEIINPNASSIIIESNIQ